MFLNNRYHDPVTGQFISVDPLVSVTGEPYIYGAANPITYSDPDGLYPCPYSYIEELGCHRSPGGNTGAQNSAARKAAAPSGGPGFGSGLWDGTKAIVTGPYDTVTNPVDSVRGLWDLAAGCGASTGCLQYELFVAPSVNDYREHGLGYAVGKMVPGIAAALLTRGAGRRAPTSVSNVGEDIVGSTHRVLRPTQDWIDMSAVDNYVAQLRAGRAVAPIEVQVLPDGRAFILDGHHRYVASQRTGVPVPSVVTVGPGPVGLPDWSKVTYLGVR